MEHLYMYLFWIVVLKQVFLGGDYNLWCLIKYGSDYHRWYWNRETYSEYRKRQP